MLFDNKSKEILKESLKDLMLICFSIICLILIFLLAVIF